MNTLCFVFVLMPIYLQIKINLVQSEVHINNGFR